MPTTGAVRSQSLVDKAVPLSQAAGDSMKKRLVIVTTSFPIAGDGSESAGSFVADLAEELAKYVPVCVVAPGPGSVRERWSDGIEVIRYAAPAKPLSTLKPWRPRDLYWIVRVLRGGMAATRSIVKEGAGSIFALWGLPCGEWARRAGKVFDVPYDVWLLGSDVWSLGRKPILKRMLARVIRQSRSAYADGYGLAADGERIAGRSVDFLPSARRIDGTSLTEPRNAPPYRLLFLGRWHPNKGIDLLLDALDRLGDSDWLQIERVEIFGGGPLADVVHRRARALRERARPVTVGGFLGKAQAEAAINRSDWVLIPSRIESIPVVFSDAIKLNRPVIATPVGDLPLLLAQGCGILCDGPDADSIARAIRKSVSASSYAGPNSSLRACAEQFQLPKIGLRLVQASATWASHG